MPAAVPGEGDREGNPTRGSDDGDALEIGSMPSTPEGAGSFGSDQEEPPEEPLNVSVNLRMGYSGGVLYTAQWQSTDTVSIGHFIGIVKESSMLLKPRLR